MKIHYKGGFTDELKTVIKHFLEDIPLKYNIDTLGVNELLYSMLINKSAVYIVLSNFILEKDIEALINYTSSALNLDNDNNNTEIDDEVLDSFNRLKKKEISTVDVLLSMLEISETMRKTFERNGIEVTDIKSYVGEFINNNKKPINRKNNSRKQPLHKKQNINDEVNIIDNVDFVINLNEKSEEGEIDVVIGNDDVYENIFNILAKRNKNNVVVVGNSGVGKTATVKNIANKIISGDVPKKFKNKTLYLIDFVKLVSGTIYKGSFETKIDAIVSSARDKNNCIFFIDDIQSILSDKSRFGEVDIVSILDKILNEKNIQFISTASNSGYRTYFENNPSLDRRFEKIVINQPSIEESINILTEIKENFELHHNVVYTKEAIEEAVRLSSRYLSEQSLPDSAINLIDEVGASKVVSEKTSSDVIKLKEELDRVYNKKEELKHGSHIDYVEIDKAIREEIRLKNEISKKEKEETLNSKPIVIVEDDIRNIIHKKTNIPIQTITEDDIKSLKNISSELKKYVIGQDEAIDGLTNVIKRQRVGISNPNKPNTFLMVGSTGTGKTYLAKMLSKVLFGSEDFLVRLDMSEYTDKSSTNKLIGSSSGYVGYENGGILTKAIRKNKYCVLLLDEIEKAADEVFDVFLQVFDDGRLTDNHGNLVDFKNVIIIMTSNVGAKEMSEFGNGIGFNRNKSETSRNILDKSLKRKFKPEFINRIDKVIYFDKLNDDNIKHIIKLEIEKVNKRLKEIGYSLDTSITNGKLIDKIFNNILDDKEYGARPIIRQIQDLLEDRITEYILNNNIEKGHIFIYKDLYDD